LCEPELFGVRELLESLVTLDIRRRIELRRMANDELCQRYLNTEVVLRWRNDKDASTMASS